MTQKERGSASIKRRACARNRPSRIEATKSCEVLRSIGAPSPKRKSAQGISHVSTSQPGIAIIAAFTSLGSR